MDAGCAGGTPGVKGCCGTGDYKARPGKMQVRGAEGGAGSSSTLLPTKPVAPSVPGCYTDSIMQQPIKTATPIDMETRFRALADQWRWETGPLSSSSKIAAHPAYQEIIGMGPAAIPLVLRELQERCDHWFAALRALSGENPVPREFAGRVPKMREIWLEWGREKGYIS